MWQTVIKRIYDDDDDVFVVRSEDLDVKITGPGQAEVLKKEQKDNKVAFVYRTLSPGEFDIHIKNKGKAIHGSPFSAKISGM